MQPVHMLTRLSDVEYTAIDKAHKALDLLERITVEANNTIYTLVLKACAVADNT